MGLLPPVREGAQGRGRQVFQLVARMPQITASNVICSCFVSSARYTGKMHESTETERPRDLEARCGLRIAAAHHDLLDRLRLEFCPRHGVTDRMGGHVGAPHLVEGAAMGLADRRAGGRDDDGFGHGFSDPLWS